MDDEKTESERAASRLLQTIFGSFHIVPLGMYVVKVKYHPSESFSTHDREVLRHACEVLDSLGRNYSVERLDWYRRDDRIDEMTAPGSISGIT
jgi:hypothetical protein